MKIDGATKIEQSYLKHITLTHEDITYYANLYWESGAGFDLVFTSADYNRIERPKWAVDWEETNPESLCLTLDELTDEELSQ